jgi:Ankyrin repeats (many copies)
MFTNDGLLSLSLAANVETVELLLRCEKIKTNMLDRRGLSAFHNAVMYRRVDIVSCMLQSERIDPNLLTSSGQHVLALTQTPEVKELLLQSDRIIQPATE